VLRAPDNQSLGNECEQYEAFVEALPAIDVAPQAAFPSVEPPSGAPALARPSLPRRRRRKRGRLWTEPEGLTVNGMSGSPLISTTGTAIGVVSTNNIAACLVNGLPGWLVRELR